MSYRHMSGGFSHGAKLFCCGRMDANSGINILLLGAKLQSGREALNDFTSLRPNHVHTKYVLSVGVDDHLHQALFLAARQRVAHWGNGLKVNVQIVPTLLRHIFVDACTHVKRQIPLISCLHHQASTVIGRTARGELRLREDR